MPCEKIEFMNAVIKGALAGFIATIPMTLAMKVLHAQLPREERYPLPPRLIVESTAEKLEVQDDLSEENEYALPSPRISVTDLRPGQYTAQVLRCKGSSPQLLTVLLTAWVYGR